MIAVIGGGPAGLRAAEVCTAAGVAVTVFDAKASVGRKFLVAGSGGLNLTKAEAVEKFAERYRGPGMPPGLWTELLAESGPEALRAWADGLGAETFVASTGRVYPREMKAAPLLRAWVQRLRRAGVTFAMRHRWSGWREGTLAFATPDGTRLVDARATVLALGGGSWPETGSDGGWVGPLRAAGVDVAELRSANCGWEVAWPAGFLAVAEGAPLKNVLVHAGGESARGELLVTRYGLEGGAIYALGAALRAMERPEIVIDLKPDAEAERLRAKLGPARRNWTEEARRRWRLDPAAAALLAGADSAEALVKRVKRCRVGLRGPRPLAEAISSAGGVRWSEIDQDLMLRRVPGIFVAGEMLDWEAPTGGYLLQGAFATGTRAGWSALEWNRTRP